LERHRLEWLFIQKKTDLFDGKSKVMLHVAPESCLDSKERLRVFGQEDHVRRYGPDYVDRLREAGFTVEITGINGSANDKEAVEMGLTAETGMIYYCTKQMCG